MEDISFESEVHDIYDPKFSDQDEEDSQDVTPEKVDHLISSVCEAKPLHCSFKFSSTKNLLNLSHGNTFIKRPSVLYERKVVKTDSSKNSKNIIFLTT
jgi:hypothetical protein